LIWSPASHHPVANVTRAARGKNTRLKPLANEMNPGPLLNRTRVEQHGDRGHDGERGEREEHRAEDEHHGIEFRSVISKTLPSGSRK
jgi:hypothetical protein